MDHFRQKRPGFPSPLMSLPVHSLGFDEDCDSLSSRAWRSSVGSTVSMDSTLPPVICSKYSVIGDPRSRKAKFKQKPKLWHLPGIEPESSLLAVDSNDRLFDRLTLYGTHHRRKYDKLTREKTNYRLLEDMSRVPGPEKMYLVRDYKNSRPYSRFKRDEVHIPSMYPNYFGGRRNREGYIRQKYTDEYRRRNSKNTTCAKGFREPTDSVHFCDVLGKRFCKDCEEYSNRLFSWKYERKKMFPYQYVYDESNRLN